MRTTQRGVLVQYATKRVADAPDRFRLLLEVMNQLIHQVVPVVVRRKTRVMGVLLQMRDLILRRKCGKQLAVGA
ncbi:hypothetical protein D3C76_1519630 [compost metagenome]